LEKENKFKRETKLIVKISHNHRLQWMLAVARPTELGRWPRCAGPSCRMRSAHSKLTVAMPPPLGHQTDRVRRKQRAAHPARYDTQLNLRCKEKPIGIIIGG
jgi:hypothetical protein